MTGTLIQRLRRHRGDYVEEMDEAADALEQQAAQVAEKDAEIARLKTVMIAAAEEIGAHWDAHCDAEGYGPVNLLRRLEQGIQSEYGYTSGAFARMKAEVEALRADAERLRHLLQVSMTAMQLSRFPLDWAVMITAIDAALRQEQPT